MVEATPRQDTHGSSGKRLPSNGAISEGHLEDPKLMTTADVLPVMTYKRSRQGSSKLKLIGVQTDCCRSLAGTLIGSSLSENLQCHVRSYVTTASVN
jgi:hypothetical protein